MNRATLWIVLLSFCVSGITGCSGGHHHATAVTVSTAPTTLAVGATGNFAATVVKDSANGGVMWTCLPTTSCGVASFSIDQTPSGTTTVFTAPPIAPAGGQVTITATSVANAAVAASVNVTITPNSFSFYAIGEENNNDIGDTYTIAGVVSVGPDGTVLIGEQDFNDGDANLSPQPQGDSITGGSLVMNSDGSGNGTLTLITDNPALGVMGTETFAVASSNSNHALIVQFDGSATSSGSLDFQTSISTPAASGFAFVVSGVDASAAPTADGGVFTVDSSGNITGTVDVNDAGGVTLNTAFTGTLSAPDSLGRGTVTSTTGPLPVSINYYVVGPEVIRIIDVDATDTAVGSAYGQGASPSFSNASIGQSVFSISNSSQLYAAAGQFTTVTNNFSGVGDENESVSDGSLPVLAQPISGTYTLATTGYGSFTFVAGLGSISNFGIYAVDPALNILDPNNTTSGGAGALIAEMDANLVGAGARIPQTNTAVASFVGSYAFGAQGDTSGFDDEFDFVGEATVAADTGVFAGTGALSDPLAALTGIAVESANATFTSTASPDVAHLGRYTLNPLVLAASNGTDFSAVNLLVTAYQANGGQLFWVEVDDGTFFGGSLEQSAAPAAGIAKKTNLNKKNH
jgi:hypothetical protein